MVTHSNTFNQLSRLHQQNAALMRALRSVSDEQGILFHTDNPTNPTYFIGPPSRNSIRKGKYKRGDWIVLIATTPLTKAQVETAVVDMELYSERS